jgi:tetratricopeptide (TPR) repeat protein
MDKEMILAIGELWKLGLVIIILAAIVIFRSNICILLNKVNQFHLKKGDTEITLCEEKRKSPEVAETINKSIIETVASEENIIINNQSQENKSPDFWDAYFENDIEKLKVAYEQMQLNEGNLNVRLYNEALFYRMSYNLGEHSCLDKLKNMLTNTTPESDVYSSIVSFIGMCLEKGNAFNKAIELYDNELQKLKFEKDIAEVSVNKADCLFKMGSTHYNEAYNTIKNQLLSIKDPIAKFNLYKGLAKLYEKVDERLSQALALEKALEICPDNVDLRFDIAYAYSMTDFKDLSLLHYKILLRFDSKNNSGWNNLGVQYDALAMPILSVDCYKTAQGETSLASSNLAYKLLHAGFTEEAKKILGEAMLQENPHPNVSTAMSNVKTFREAEESKEKSIIGLATQKQLYLLQFSSRYLSKETNLTFEGLWKSDQGYEVTITLTNDVIRAVVNVEDCKYNLKGNVINDAAIIDLSSNIQGLLIGKHTYKGFAYLTDEGTKIQLVLSDDKDLILKSFLRKEHFVVTDDVKI